MRRDFLTLAVFALPVAACAPREDRAELQRAYRELQTRYTADEATIEMLEGRLKVTMADRILFPSGGYSLTEQAREMLRKMVPTLRNLTWTRVIVEGHTDNVPVSREMQRAGIASNLDLSSRRADIVADVLVRDGVPRGIVSAEGRGDANPVAPNATAEGRARNRRIEVTLAGPGN